MKRLIVSNLEEDQVDRRGFLECIAWAGTGMLWGMAGGVANSRMLGADKGSANGFTFVQISDSHIGFNRPANPDVNATLQVATAKINALADQPDFVIHTGDLTHSAKPGEF